MGKLFNLVEIVVEAIAKHDNLEGLSTYEKFKRMTTREKRELLGS